MAEYFELPRGTCTNSKRTCYLPSFFGGLTLRDQLDPQQKHLLRVEEMRHADWLICQGTSKFVARQVVSLMKNEQQSQNLLLKVDLHSTFRNMFLLRNKLIRQGEKRKH